MFNVIEAIKILFKKDCHRLKYVVIVLLTIVIISTVYETFIIRSMEKRIEDLKYDNEDYKYKIDQKNAEIAELNTKMNELQNTSTFTPFEIIIIDPKDGEEVSVDLNDFGLASINVNGTFLGMMPENQYMWIVVNPYMNPGSWWPQEQINTSEKLWKARSYLGMEGDIGKYDIAVVSVNEQDNQYYMDYQKKGSITGYYPPLQPPASLKFFYTITVNRK